MKAGSERSYVRAKVTVSVPNWSNENELFITEDELEMEETPFEAWAKTFEDYFQYKGNSGFNCGGGIPWTSPRATVSSDDKTIVYYLVYQNDETGNTVDASGADVVLEPIFDKIKAPSSLTNAQLAALAGMEIKVEGHAIQADGFGGESSIAWLAFESAN